MPHRQVASIVIVVMLTLSLSATILAAAEETTPDLNATDAIRQTLEQQMGKRAKLRLMSGQDLDGKVQKVGLQAVTLAELAGMELFDATVRLDQVAAVLVKVRGK